MLFRHMGKDFGGDWADPVPCGTFEIGKRQTHRVEIRREPERRNTSKDSRANRLNPSSTQLAVKLGKLGKIDKDCSDIEQQREIEMPNNLYAHANDS